MNFPALLLLAFTVAATTSALTVRDQGAVLYQGVGEAVLELETKNVDPDSLAGFYPDVEDSAYDTGPIVHGEQDQLELLRYEKKQNELQIGGCVETDEYKQTGCGYSECPSGWSQISYRGCSWWKKDRRCRRTQRTCSQVNIADASSGACNGVQGLCAKKYDEVTFAATHNAGAYDLDIDCKKIAKCTEKVKQCTGGWETKCVEQEKSCTSKVWSWLSWACKAYSYVCKKSQNVCKGYGMVCKTTVMACEHVVPDAIEKCIWENQDRSVGAQLNDGIRYLDIDICPKDGTTATGSGEIVMCHGKGDTPRALGQSLATGLSQVNEFLSAHPGEVVTLKFGDYDGAASYMGPALKSLLLKSFGSKLYAGSFTSWPTLHAMKNTPVVIAMNGGLIR